MPVQQRRGFLKVGFRLGPGKAEATHRLPYPLFDLPHPQSSTVFSPDRNHYKRTKASTMIAALNIKGLGNPNPWHPKHKWYHINQLVKEDKAGILIVAEVHMNAAGHAKIQKLFGRRLEILYTGGPEMANGKGLAL
ncbi:hypothetical protein B0H13DRAFT_1870497 [Mycena leptocephala]|nr:hypothetical protein B0H13DRAFT_1870497 [Mycena leptocephala]